MLKTVPALADDRQDRLLVLCEATARLRRPLHWRPSAIAFRQPQIVAHSDLIDIAKHRGARQGHQQAVGEFHAPTIPLKHGCEATSNSADRKSTRLNSSHLGIS